MISSDKREQLTLVTNQTSTQEISAEFEKDKLVDALQAVSAAQIDADIGWVQIIFTGENKVLFSSTSHNLSIKYEFETPHSGAGIIKVSGRQFSEYVKQLPPARVYMKAELPSCIRLKCAGSSAKIQLVQDQNLSQVLPAPVGSSVLVKGSFLERWISSFKDLVLVDDSRFYANGALVWVDSKNENSCLYAVASDALRLSQSCLTEGVTVLHQDTSQVIVPKKALEELKRESSMSPDKEFTLKWSKDELCFSAECDGYMLAAKCIAGQYPPYEAAFPQKNNFEIFIDLKAMQESVRRSLIFADKNRVMKLIFENSLLKISSFTQGQKEGEEIIEIHTNLNSSFEVNYNGHHLSGILSVISGSRVNFSWESITKPVKIVGEEQIGLKVFYLLVPSRF